MKLKLVSQPKASKAAPARPRKQASLHSKDVNLHNGFIRESYHGHAIMIDPFSGCLMSNDLDD